MYEIRPCVTGTKDRADWVYPDLAKDFKQEETNPDIKAWRSITPRMFDHALNVLPPILLDGIRVFMVREPYTDDAKGRTVYAMFAELGSVPELKRHYARYSTRETWREDLAGLVQALARVSG